MCEDHGSVETDHDATAAPGPSRRRFLQGVSALAAGLFLGGPSQLLLPRPAGAALNSSGLTAFRHAMHVHTCFSEGAASLQAQVHEAIANGFHTLWTTDHDWRMSAYQAPDVFHFATNPEVVVSKSYSWVASTTGGASAAKSGGIVGTPTSPLDPAPAKGALQVHIQSSGTTAARHLFKLNGDKADQCQRTNLAGQTLVLDVLPDSIGSNSWGEVLIALSYRPAVGGRSAGHYQLTYRLGTKASRFASGTSGIINVPVTAGRWNTVTLDPAADVALLWPDLNPGDNHLVDLTLGATSRSQAVARLFYGHLRFARTMTDGDQPLVNQARLVASYAERYPQLTIRQGVEVSGTSDQHSNWFGGSQHLIDYRQPQPADLLAHATGLIHASGGLASLNHPFNGGESGALATQSEQDSKRRNVAQRLLGRGLGGVDVVEAGYRRRDGMSLETHLSLVDTFWRSGYWVTATGVSDNHNGKAGTWATEVNRFYSTIWQADGTEAGTIRGLRRGEVFVGELGGFHGYLDLKAGGNPMGSVSVAPGLGVRELTVTGVDLPTGSTVELTRGPIDYSGALDPGTIVVAQIPAASFTTGSTTVTVDCSRSCFVRASVLDSSGRRVAFTNPVFLLQEEPPAGRAVPSARRAPDSIGA